MREEWIHTTLGDVAVLEYGKALKETDRDGDGFPVFGSAGEVGWHSVPLVADGPVIIVGRKGTAGAVHWSPGPCSVIDTAYWLRITEAQMRIDFAYLAISSLHLPSLSAQTGVPGLNRDRAYSQPVSVPTVPEQRRIVDLVGTIDSSIDSLQTQAQATRAARSAVLSELLSSPGNDWQTTTLGELADYQNGFAFKPEHLAGSALPVIRIRQLLDEAEVPDRTDIAVSERHRIDDGDIVFSWSATLAVRIWNRGPAVLNQHLFKVLAKPQVEPAWLALALDDAIRDLAGKAHGTTMKHITKGALSAHAISLPPRKEQLRIADLVGSFDKQIASLESQTGSAQSFRAGVLSELLSGERLLDESYDVAVSP